jgi:hypothetical protein
MTLLQRLSKKDEIGRDLELKRPPTVNRNKEKSLKAILIGHNPNLFAGIFEPIFDVDSLFVDQHRRIRLQQDSPIEYPCINPDYIQESE